MKMEIQYCDWCGVIIPDYAAHNRTAPIRYTRGPRDVLLGIESPKVSPVLTFQFKTGDDTDLCAECFYPAMQIALDHARKSFEKRREDNKALNTEKGY